MNKQHLIALTVIGFSRFALCEAAGVDPCETSLPLNCTADVNGDSAVDVVDLLAVIDSWGSCDMCSADINDDGVVDVSDLLLIIGSWGPC